jgi:uncharacterized short protein YbdD (DUF466 family)
MFNFKNLFSNPGNKNLTPKTPPPPPPKKPKKSRIESCGGHLKVLTNALRMARTIMYGEPTLKEAAEWILNPTKEKHGIPCEIWLTKYARMLAENYLESEKEKANEDPVITREEYQSQCEKRIRELKEKYPEIDYEPFSYETQMRINRIFSGVDPNLPLPGEDKK